MPIASIEISQNPVKTWETYHRSLYPKQTNSEGEFFEFDRDKAAEKGFGRCRFKFRESQDNLEAFFEYGLGRDIKVYNHAGAIDYEGFIFSLTLDTGVHTLTKTLEHVFNKVWARYDASGGVNPTQRSTVYQNSDSQSRFGIIEKVMGGGQQAAAAPMNQAVQNRLALHGWPMINPDYGRSRGQPHIAIIAIGYHHTLNWQTYNQTAIVGDTDISVVATDVLANCGQFIASSDITTNTLQVPREYDVDSLAGDVLKNLAAMGDASGNRWISRVGIGRKYTLAPSRAVSVVRYMLNVWDPDKRIFDDQGSLVAPSEVEPNEWIRLSGAASITSKVYTSNVDDPTISFIEDVGYRMERDEVVIKANPESMLQAFFKRLGGTTT